MKSMRAASTVASFEWDANTGFDQFDKEETEETENED